jgi:hypothetical protein
MNLTEDIVVLMKNTPAEKLFIEADKLIKAGKAPDDPQCRAGRVLRRALIEVSGKCLISSSQEAPHITLLFTRGNASIQCQGNNNAKRVFTLGWDAIQDLRRRVDEHLSRDHIDEGLWDKALEVAYDLLASRRRSAKNFAGRMLKQKLLELAGTKSIELADDVKMFCNPPCLQCATRKVGRATHELPSLVDRP